MQLRSALGRSGLIRLVGSHDALGARLAERAGFDGVWASSLEISASRGVPDAGILSVTEFLAAAASMARAINIPIVADCDSGFGTAINVMHMVRDYEAAGIAAVCIEDKAFPKVNSLLARPQLLAEVAEFVGKIEAAKNAQRTSEFVVIARVEALVAGAGHKEALRRARAYADAGADAILIHDTSSTPRAIEEFCAAWDSAAPLVVVPTTYSSVTASDLAAMGISVVIYANHGLRARIRATESTFAQILRDGTAAGAEREIASVSSLFELQGYPQLALDEQRYVDPGRRPVDRANDVEGETLSTPSPRDRLGITRQRPLEARDIVDAFERRGLGPYIGVPCSYLGPIIDHLVDDRPGQYFAANNEGEAVAIAAGFYLGGRTPVVMLQNSGLGNATNPLTSLAHVFRIPMLMLVTWRGEPGLNDEPQHELMGRITTDLLELMDVPFALFPERLPDLERCLDEAVDHLRSRRAPFALVARKDVVAPSGGRARTVDVSQLSLPEAQVEPDPAHSSSRRDAIRTVVSCVRDDALFVSTTGKTSRELAEDHDRGSNLYVVGSMGCASSVALGIALCQPERRLVVLDGDGAALMRLEAMASIGHFAPRNLMHVILDNLAYESTGSQATQSASVDFPALAGACGYRSASSCSSLRRLAEVVSHAEASDGPHLVHVRIRVGSDPELKRPTVCPAAVAERFRALARAGSVAREGDR